MDEDEDVDEDEAVVLVELVVEDVCESAVDAVVVEDASSDSGVHQIVVLSL